MKKTLQAILFASASAVAGFAAATTYNTSTPGISVLGTAGAPIYCNASGCTSTTPGSMTGYVTLTAWSTSGTIAGSTSATTDNTAWIAAKIAVYAGGGIGITNTLQPTATETGSPQHAIDNNGLDDILVVDFGSAGWDVNSFFLGYTCNASTGVCGSGVAVEAWVGGNAGNAVNFTGATFSANNSLSAVPLVSGATFTRLTLANDPLTGNTGNVTEAGSATGRYLILTGALAAGTASDLGTAVTGYSDAFKVKELVATKGSGGQAVPTPGSVALMGLGLLALAFARRRLVRIA